MALRELLLKLGVEVDENGAKKADATMSGLKKAAIGAAAAFAAFKGAKIIASAVDELRILADEVGKTSLQLGISAQALEEFRFAADLAGVDGKAFGNSLGRLQKNAFEASKGNKTLGDDFKRLGINVKDSTGELKSGEDLLTEFADGIQGLTNDSEKVALSMNLMGRTGKQLLPMFVNGAKGMAAARAEARELGGVFGDELIKDMEQLSDDQARFNFGMRGIKTTIVKELLPAFMGFAKGLIVLVKQMRGPVKAVMARVGRIFNAFVDVGKALAEVLLDLDKKFGILKVIFGVLAVGIGVLSLAMVAFGLVAAKTAIAFALAWISASAPLILLIALFALIGAAVFLVIDDFLAFQKGGKSVIGTLLKEFFGLEEGITGFGDVVEFVFDKVIQNIKDLVQEFSDAVADVVGLGESAEDKRTRESREARGRRVGRVKGFRRGRLGNLGGVDPVLAAAGAAGGNGGVSNVTQSTVVEVDARGATDPQAVATKTAKATQAANAPMLRQAAKSYATQKP